MLYANVNGLKSRPAKGLRGLCPCCGESVTAKCGAIVTHHWAHLAGSECDPWAENIGPWHLGWQNLVEAQNVEVVIPPHRADILGNENVVVELQHSPISAEEIAAREAFYDNMVWLFDATERFDLINTGRRTFFSFLRTRHIPLCTKPVFLDFGGMIVQVEAFTEAMVKLDGYGMTRSPEWFVNRYLSKKLRAGTPVPSSSFQTVRWTHHQRFSKLKHPSLWFDPATKREIRIEKGSISVDCNWYRQEGYGPKQFEWERLVDDHPLIANGWTKSEIVAIRKFLNGTITIVDGLLRVMPSPKKDIKVNLTEAVTRDYLCRTNDHIAAGRVPILKEETKHWLLEQARMYDQQNRAANRESDEQLSLL